MKLNLSDSRIAVIGLGYVGLPLLIEFAKNFNCVGFDINKKRISDLEAGVDLTNELTADELATVEVRYTSDISELRDCNVYIVTVPTPIDAQKRPNLTPLEASSATVGSVLSPGDIVIYESTVYPGATEPSFNNRQRWSFLNWHLLHKIGCRGQSAVSSRYGRSSGLSSFCYSG